MLIEYKILKKYILINDKKEHDENRFSVKTVE